jgi:hypothetical protein
VEETIFAQIRREAKDFYEHSISVVPGYSFNQYTTLKRIHLYLNSKYENGGQYLGRDLIFFNVVNGPCEVAARMLNIDTKNIRLWPTNPKSYFSTWLLEKELKQWLKTSKMGKLLNQMAEEAPRYGTVVLEKTKDGARVVDLRRLINDQTVDNITDSRFVTTIHYMTPTQLRETDWDNVERAIELFGSPELQESFEDEAGNYHQMRSTPYVKVYRRYGEVPAHWVDDSLRPGTKAGDKLVRSLMITAGADYQTESTEGKGEDELGLILFKSRWHKAWPFKDFHYQKIKGRYLGMGIVEMLFDVQVRMNEIKNAKRFSMDLSSMHLFQTKDKIIVRNALTDLQTGDVLYSPNGIEPILNEERNLPAFKDEEESYQMHADRISFATDAVNGSPLPASTPATNAIIAQQGSASVYAFKRENLALMLQDFFNDLVLPQCLKDLNAEHVMRFVGTSQELLKLDVAAAELFANDFIKNRILAGETFTPEDVEAVKEEAKTKYRTLGETRFLKMKKAFYGDVEFEFDIVVGNEQVDPATIAINTQAALSSVAANPAILQDPRIKMLFFKYAESLGVSPAEMELADTQAAQMEQSLLANPQPNVQGPVQNPGPAVTTLPPLAAAGQ